MPKNFKKIKQNLSIALAMSVALSQTPVVKVEAQSINDNIEEEIVNEDLLPSVEGISSEDTTENLTDETLDNIDTDIDTDNNTNREEVIVEEDSVDEDISPSVEQISGEDMTENLTDETLGNVDTNTNTNEGESEEINPIYDEEYDEYDEVENINLNLTLDELNEYLKNNKFNQEDYLLCYPSYQEGAGDYVMDIKDNHYYVTKEAFNYHSINGRLEIKVYNKYEGERSKLTQIIHCELAEENSPRIGKLRNEFIAANVGLDGRFNIGTTGGNLDKESDNNKTLLCGYPGNSTSYTSINIDGEVYEYNQESTIKTNSNAHISTTKYGDIEVIQEISINSRNKDMVNIKYKVKNTGSKSHDLGLRIMMDTMLGDNDRAPFRVAGKSITTESEFSGNNMPDFWQAFDDLEDPTVIAQGNVGTVSNKPSKVQFANWGRLSADSWDYKISNDSNIGDSAVALTWNSKTLNPGSTLEFETQYGIGEYTGQATEDLYLALSGLDKINFVEDKYETEKFNVTSIIKNTTNKNLKNVKATIELDRGLKLEDESKKTISVENINSGEEIDLLWNVVLDKSEYTQNDRNLSYKVVVTADNMEASTVERSIRIQGNPSGKEIISISNQVIIDSISSLDNFKEKLIELLNKKDEHGRDLYKLPQDRIEKEVLSDNSELYTLVLQELRYNDITRALAMEGKVVKEYVIKIKITKDVVAILNGNSNNNKPNNNKPNNNKPNNNKPNNNKPNNNKPSTSTGENPNTGDTGILGYVGIGLSALGLLTIRRKRK